MRIEKACPMLPAADLAGTVSYYVEKLGFNRLALSDGHAIVERDGAEIHFWPCSNKLIAENSSAYLRVHDVDALFASMPRAGEGGKVTPPADREWGQREFCVIDPDGNLLRFGQPSRRQSE